MRSSAPPDVEVPGGRSPSVTHGQRQINAPDLNLWPRRRSRCRSIAAMPDEEDLHWFVVDVPDQIHPVPTIKSVYGMHFDGGFDRSIRGLRGTEQLHQILLRRRGNHG